MILQGTVKSIDCLLFFFFLRPFRQPHSLIYENQQWLVE